MGVENSTQHLVFRQLFGLRLNHQDRITGTRYHHVQLALFERGISRVKYVALCLAKANASTTDGAIEGAA